MTTTATMPEPAAAERVLRIPPIAANLLPQEIIDAHRARRTRRLVVALLAAFVALLAAWYGLASYQTSVARTGLADAEVEAQRLVHQQRDFGDLAKAQAESQAIGTQLSALLANDLSWSKLLGSLQRAAPSGVQLTGVSGTLTPASEETAGKDRPGAAKLPNGSADKSIGTMTVTGWGSSKAVVAAYLDALAKVPGLGNPLLDAVTVLNGALQFTATLDITGAALGGRYSGRKGTGTVQK